MSANLREIEGLHGRTLTVNPRPECLVLDVLGESVGLDRTSATELVVSVLCWLGDFPREAHTETVGRLRAIVGAVARRKDMAAQYPGELRSIASALGDAENEFIQFFFGRSSQ